MRAKHRRRVRSAPDKIGLSCSLLNAMTCLSTGLAYGWAGRKEAMVHALQGGC